LSLKSGEHFIIVPDKAQVNRVRGRGNQIRSTTYSRHEGYSRPVPLIPKDV